MQKIIPPSAADFTHCFKAVLDKNAAFSRFCAALYGGTIQKRGFLSILHGASRRRYTEMRL